MRHRLGDFITGGRMFNLPDWIPDPSNWNPNQIKDPLAWLDEYISPETRRRLADGELRVSEAMLVEGLRWTGGKDSSPPQLVCFVRGIERTDSDRRMGVSFTV